MLRARVTGVRGSEVNLENFRTCGGRGSLAREYAITYRDHLEANERSSPADVLERTGRSRRTRPLSEVSIEESIHERFNINVGDEMRFDVLGRTHPRPASPASVRSSGRTRAAAGSCSCSARARSTRRRTPSSASSRRRRTRPRAARFQRDLVAQFPNVSAIDVREILARIQAVVDNVTLGISIVGGIALLSGVLILIGAVAMTKFQRVYEAAILRTLGASTRLLGTTLALEYCALGLLAGAVGAAGALG